MPVLVACEARGEGQVSWPWSLESVSKARVAAFATVLLFRQPWQATRGEAAFRVNEEGGL